MARVRQWQYKVLNFLGRIIWRLSWRNRNRKASKIVGVEIQEEVYEMATR